MDLSWHALNSMIQAKTLYHTEKQGFGNPWLSKPKFQTHALKPSPVSERSACPCKTTYAFPCSPLG